MVAGPATFAGPDGVEARWVIQENDKPGTTAWEIHGVHGGISGFANQVYAQQVAGLSGYSFLDDTFYLEFGGYWPLGTNTLGALGIDTTGQSE